MSMELERFFTISDELRLFGLSVLWGLGIGLIFDAFRLLRAVLPHNATLVFIEDALFLLVYALSLVCFSTIFGRGMVRGYFAVGNLIGFIVYFLTIGTVLIGVVRKIIRPVKALAALITKFALKLFHIISRTMNAKFGKSSKISK